MGLDAEPWAGANPKHKNAWVPTFAGMSGNIESPVLGVGL